MFRSVIGCALVFGASCLAVAQGGKVASSSGKTLCSALTPADFAKAGVPVTRLKEANLDGTDSAYCVYESKAGKVEFDIFYPAGANVDEVKATERTMLNEIGGKFISAVVAGADEAKTNVAAPKDAGSASIAVRKGMAVFDINIPQGAKALRQLLVLSEIVLSRLKQ
jgi:hypothetical protein